MSSNPFGGAFPHQHRDPRSLAERIQAQIAERIAEAVDMAALKLMVELRQHHGRPAPETSNDADRQEFERLSADVLQHLHAAFHAQLSGEDRAELERAEAGLNNLRERYLSGQVLLARRLSDYWQRFETHQAEFAESRLAAPPKKEGWLMRLFKS